MLLTLPTGARWAIEIKRSLTPKLERGFHEACADIMPDQKMVVIPKGDSYRIYEDIRAVSFEACAREVREAVNRG